MSKERTSGISLIEFLMALLILLFIITGLNIGFFDLLKRQKQVELHNRARSLLEDIGSRLGVDNPDKLKTLTTKSGTCTLNGTCDFESICFTGTYSNTTNCAIYSQEYHCLYCLTGQRLIPINCTSNCTCSSGYPVYVDYDLYRLNLYLLNLNTQDGQIHAADVGVGICLRTRFIDPYFNQSDTSQFKEYRKLILNTGIF